MLPAFGTQVAEGVRTMAFFHSASLTIAVLFVNATLQMRNTRSSYLPAVWERDS